MTQILLLDCERVIEDEISMGLKQADIAITYRMAMQSDHAGVWDVDWGRINRAIINRWSMSGLERVKRFAHRPMRAAPPASGHAVGED